MNITRTIALAIAVAVMAALILTLGPMACNAIRSQKAQQRVTQAQLGAAHESAADAIDTTGAVAANEAAAADLTRTNEEGIRHAQGASDPVAADVRDVGLRALCRRKSAANDPKCRLQQPAP